MSELILSTPSRQIIKPLIETAIQNEIRILEEGLKHTESRLRVFEERHKMDTETFLRRYEAGKLEETLHFAEWVGEYRTAQRLRAKIQALREIRFENRDVLSRAE